MRSAALVLSMLVIAACGGGDQQPQAGTSTTVVAPPGVEALELPSTGAGRIVIGASLDVSLEIQICERDEASVPEGTAPAELVVVEATGTRADGVAVLVDVRRFRTAGDLPTITDTVTVVEGPQSAPERVLQAQRFEVGGRVTDPRDPDADDPILRLRSASVTGEAVFGPPGAFAGDRGLVAGSFALGCAG